MRSQVFENLRIPIGGFLFEIEYLCNQNIATMERTKRIRLSKDAKFVLRLLNNGHYTCPKATPFAVFNDGAHELESNHLAVCHEEEGGNVETARLTDVGKLYISQNPDLRNPVDWKWVITTTITAIGTILMVIVGCKVINQ